MKSPYLPSDSLSKDGSETFDCRINRVAQLLFNAMASHTSPLSNKSNGNTILVRIHGLPRLEIQQTGDQNSRLDKVAHLDLIFVFGGDCLSVDLLRCSNETALWCPLFRGQDYGFQKLHTLEAVFLADIVECLEDQGSGLLILAYGMHILIRQTSSGGITLQGSSQIMFVRKNDAHGLLSVSMSMNANVGNDVATLVGGLETLEGNVLSSTEFNQVLDPVNDAESAIFVPLTDISRAKPAIWGEYGGVVVEIVSLEISLGHRRATDEDFAALWSFRGDVASFWSVQEFDLDGGYRDTNIAVLHELGWENGAHAVVEAIVE